MADKEGGSLWGSGAGEGSRYTNLMWGHERGLKEDFRESALSGQLPSLFWKDAFWLETMGSTDSRPQRPWCLNAPPPHNSQ